MPLTVETASRAGQLADAIITLTSMMDSVQTAVDDGVIITQVDVRLKKQDGSPDTMHGEFDFTATESASVFNSVVAIYQSRITDLNAQLATLVP